MFRKLALLLAVLLPIFGSSVGCDQRSLVAVPLPPQVADTPTCNIPPPLRQKNWLGPKGQGSCVYASLTSHARWLNLFRIADLIAGPRGDGHGKYGDGEFETRLMENLDREGIDHAETRKADPRFLDWCDKERRGAIMWWKPYHCCLFVGWVEHNGRQYAAILDNNRTEDFELTEREQFIRLWAGYGGFALCIMSDPATSVPYPSYYVEAK